MALQVQYSAVQWISWSCSVHLLVNVKFASQHTSALMNMPKQMVPRLAVPELLQDPLRTYVRIAPCLAWKHSVQNPIRWLVG